jgi:hypothetical protein
VDHSSAPRMPFPRSTSIRMRSLISRPFTPGISEGEAKQALGRLRGYARRSRAGVLKLRGIPSLLSGVVKTSRGAPGTRKSGT